jgi:c(7)-type cytochrome triheme protein
MKHTSLMAVAAFLVSMLVLVSCNTGGIGQSSATRSADYVVEGGVSRGKVWHDNRQYEARVTIETLQEDGIHDKNNAAIKTLQDPKEALSAFPYDRRGGIDWVKALDLGIIDPRANLKGDSQIVTMDLDIMFKDTGNMPWVRFPHIAHTKWLDCSNCHPKIFIPQKGANNPSMDGILAGEHCGRCHDKVAFALWVCERCHSVPHNNSPQKWWGENKNERFSNAKSKNVFQLESE